MQPDELSALIERSAALMEQFERRCDEIDKRLRTLSQDLQRLTQQVPALVRQSADASLQTLPGLVLSKVQGGLEPPVSAYEQRLRAADGEIGDGAQALATQLQRMEGLHRHLLWKTAGAVLGSMLLLLAGGGWLSWQYRNDIRENQMAAQLLRAYNQADVTLCDGRLCANVDAKGRTYGDRQQYRPVLPR